MIKLVCAKLFEKGPRGGVYLRFVLEQDGGEVYRYNDRASCLYAHSQLRRRLESLGCTVVSYTRDWAGGDSDGIESPLE